MNLSNNITPKISRNQLSWRQVLLIVLILIAGLSLRLFALENIFLWNDETDNFGEQLFKHMSVSLRRYAAAEAQELTLGPAWSLIIAITCKVFGGVVKVARMPSVFLGTSTILAVFYLVYSLAKSYDDKKWFTPALFAAVLTAIAVIQIEFSQRIIPYVAVPPLAAAIIIAHLKIIQVIRNEVLQINRLVLWGVLYTFVCGFSVYLHLSLTLILVSSVILLIMDYYRCSNTDKEKKTVIFGVFILSFLAIFLAWIGNAIHTQSGYRFYLAPYYHPINLGAVPFLFSRAYDLLTYNLNLFYNDSLYWPRELNPILLPLVIVCILGWFLSIIGRFGSIAKHLSFFAIISLLVTVLLSLLMKYPFGGVRQTLFMSPFIYSFTALGFWFLIRSGLGKLITYVVVIIYLVLWSINLPHFYKERIFPYTSQELVNAWQKNDKIEFYADGGSRDTIRYLLREYPDIKIEHIDFDNDILPEAPFFFISPHWPIGASLWLPNLTETIEKSGYQVEEIIVRKAAYPVHPEYRQSLYYPPNGLWLYKITNKND